MIDNMRLLQELALESGRKRQSAQTGYLHYYYHPIEQEPHLPIPLVENFLFALALLRSKTVENIQEAKTMLEGLLHFQDKKEGNASKGNFPIYLHHFPACKDRFIGIRIACAIFWILKQFRQVVGQELKMRLEEALSLAVKQALQTHSEKEAPYPIAIKIAATAAAAGQLLEDASLKDTGWQLLETLREHPDEHYFFCPESLGSIAVSLLMIYPRLNERPWAFFWDHLQTTWHRGTATYTGPSLKEWQQREEPQATLYDLVCGYFGETFSDRALKETNVHLEAVLIPFSEGRFGPLSYPLEVHGTLQGAKWTLFHGEKFAFSCIEKKDSLHEKGFSPFRLIWGDVHRVHTFACQGGNAKTISFDKTEMIFDLEAPVDTDDREKNREILFFIDKYEALQFFVSGQKASTFRLDEPITLKDGPLTLSLSFHLEEGEGRFLGHWMTGNRPSQLDIKGEARFRAYDRQLFLRTVTRSDTCRFKVRLTIENDV
jgi:hypothetical protein